MTRFSHFTHLECARCATTHARNRLWNVCRECGSSLLARYDLKGVRRSDLPGMWRYSAVLPVLKKRNVHSLGEGMTPLLSVPALARKLGIRGLYIKEEGVNPTGSFKARGMAVAVSKAAELGVTRVCVPTAGNAGGACAAYAARAGIRARVYLPEGTPRANIEETRAAGAEIVRVKGFISDAAARMKSDMKKTRMFDLSTLKEPYRAEGKKTLGYELVDQLGRVPDVILYPTGGGTGMIGMWKAFEEMGRMKWIRGNSARMVSVQPRGCMPIVRALDRGRDECEAWANPKTVASGLRVPRAFADWLLLKIIRETRGTAVAVAERHLRDAVSEMTAMTGVYHCPEGAACLPAVRELKKRGFLRKSDTVVLFNTGSGLKYQ